MPKYDNSISKMTVRGNKEEQKLFTEVLDHYTIAKADLDVRLADFDRKDELFRSYINKANWPYNSVVFDPRIFTFITEKTSRLLANKPRGRMVAREGGDTIKAKIVNELLSYQWDDNARVEDNPMVAKWSMMDQNARRYGASFALVKWRHERRVERGTKDDSGEIKGKSRVWYDAPDFRPLINRDCLPNPSYSTIKNWFQYRDYITLQELMNVNDAARGKPVYKNLDILRQALSEAGKGDTRSSNWVSRNKSIKGLDDYLGQDELFKTVEIVTEYRNERWITFAPKHGVIIRDIENPYDHGQIPVVLLKYYPIDDDIYGLSEIEPVEKLQKAVNSLVNQYLDSVNMSLYAPLKIRAGSVQMHTLEFGPQAKWLMNDPGDVVPHVSATNGVTEFTQTYSFMISAMQNALGETSASVSRQSPFGGGEKTATEVQDMAQQRNARDNYNQIFLAEALKKQMNLWFLMDRQFMFTDEQSKQKILRIGSKDAIRFFEKVGLNGHELNPEAQDLLSGTEMAGVEMDQSMLETPLFPVETDEGVMPKMSMDETGESAQIILDKDDLSGMYDYIPDIESMSLPNSGETLSQLRQMLELALTPATTQALMEEGYSVKIKELMEDFYEKAGIKDVDKYFEKVQKAEADAANPAGTGALQAGGGNPQDVQGAGVEAALPAMA